MRFLKTLTLNRRAIYDSRVALTTSSDLTLADSRTMVLPKGNTSISSPVTGQLRYNTTSNEVEVYSGNPASWRTLRYKESTGITQQNLGVGDANTVFFGPLNPAPPAVVENGKTWGGQNLIVIVENVIQVHNTNYTIVQNPSIPGQTYSGDISSDVLVGSTVIQFDVITSPIYPSVDITGAIVTGSASLQANSAITNYTVDSQGRLTAITIDKPTVTATISSGTVLTITDASNTASGYFVQFGSAVPYGKPVIVLHGFDQ